MNVGLVLCAADGTVVDCHPAFARQLGRARDAVIGLHPTEFATPAHYARVGHVIDAALHDDNLNPCADIDHIRGDGFAASALLDALTESLSATRSAPAVPRRPGPNVSHALSSARLLLVEDNRINTLVVREMLAGVGCEVRITSDGHEALKLLESGRFDAVLMDLQMPAFDGYAATRQIRAEARFARLPIIAMTANAIPQHRADSLEASMNDHVAEPLDLDHLVATLERWLAPQ